MTGGEITLVYKGVISYNYITPFISRSPAPFRLKTPDFVAKTPSVDPHFLRTTPAEAEWFEPEFLGRGSPIGSMGFC